MTEKSNCSQLQVIFQSWDRESCPSYLHCGVLYIDALVIYGELKRKIQRESELGILMLTFLLRLHIYPDMYKVASQNHSLSQFWGASIPLSVRQKNNS